MSAKEMFEELGYVKKDRYNLFTDELMDWNYVYVKYDGNKFKEIHINSSTKLIFISDQFESQLVNQHNTPVLSFEELKAINKQIEELGWNNE